MALRSIVWKNPPEFPSDNPDLWRPRPPAEVVGMLETVTVTVSESESVSEVDSIDVEVVEFDEADFAHVEDGSIPPPPIPLESIIIVASHSEPEPVVEPVVTTDTFQLFVSTLVEVALAAGASAEVAGMVHGIVGAARLNTQSIDVATLESLVGAGLLARTESGAITRSDAVMTTAQAWRATLLGEETDLSISQMLDEWSADLVAALVCAPQRRESLRRELRSRGVAAFGLLVAA